MLKKNTMKKILLLLLLPSLLFAQEKVETKKEQGHYDNNKFSQNYDIYATPNMFRTASGAPGPAYYQQQADYKMNIVLDDKNKKIYGEETITYYNNSPDVLEYLWVQLDQNQKARDSKSPLVENQSINSVLPLDSFTKNYMEEKFDGGFKIDYVHDAKGKPLSYTVNKSVDVLKY